MFYNFFPKKLDLINAYKKLFELDESISSSMNPTDQLQMTNLERELNTWCDRRLYLNKPLRKIILEGNFLLDINSEEIFKFYLFTDLLIMVGNFHTKKGKQAYIFDCSSLPCVQLVVGDGVSLQLDFSSTAFYSQRSHSIFFESKDDKTNFVEEFNTQKVKSSSNETTEN